MKDLEKHQRLTKSIHAIFNLRDKDFRHLVEFGDITKAFMVENIPDFDFPISLAMVLKCWAIILADIPKDFFNKELKQVGAIRLQSIAKIVSTELHLDLLEVDVDFSAIHDWLFCYDTKHFCEKSVFDIYEENDYANLVRNTRSVDRELFVASCFLDFNRAFELVREGSNPYAYMLCCDSQELAEYKRMIENGIFPNDDIPKNCFSQDMFEEELLDNLSSTIFAETQSLDRQNVYDIISLAAHREMAYMLDFAACESGIKTAPQIAKSYRNALRIVLHRIMLMKPAPCFTEEVVEATVSHLSDDVLMAYAKGGTSPEELAYMITM